MNIIVEDFNSRTGHREIKEHLTLERMLEIKYSLEILKSRKWKFDVANVYDKIESLIKSAAWKTMKNDGP